MPPNSPLWDLVSRPQLFSEKMGPVERWHQCRGNGAITCSSPAAKRGSWHAGDSLGTAGTGPVKLQGQP